MPSSPFTRAVVIARRYAGRAVVSTCVLIAPSTAPIAAQDLIGTADRADTASLPLPSLRPFALARPDLADIAFSVPMAKASSSERSAWTRAGIMTAAFAGVVIVQRNRLMRQERDPVRQAAWDVPCGSKWYPDFNLTSRWDDTKQCIPRWEFHAIHAVLGTATAYAVRRVFHSSNAAAVTSSVLLVSIIPHAIGVASHAFAFNGPNWIPNAWVAGAAIIPMSAEHGFANGVTGTATWLTGYGLLYPMSSP